MTPILQKEVKSVDLIILTILNGLALFFSIFLTRIDLYYASLAIPLSLIYIFFRPKLQEKFKAIVKKDKFIKYLLMFITPTLFISMLDLRANTYFWINHLKEAHWLNVNTIYLPVLFYFAAIILLKLVKLKPFYLFSIISLSFIWDWIYAIIEAQKESLNRWDASAGNPNTWALQTGILLVSVISFRGNFIKNRLPEWLSWSIYLALILSLLSSLIFAKSIAALLALAAVFSYLAVTLTLKKRIYQKAFIYTLIATVVIFCFAICWLNLMELRPKDLYFASKFYPRIKLWRNLPEILDGFKWYNYAFGMGYQQYRSWLAMLGSTNFTHVHNVYLHYFLQYGIFGLALSQAYLLYILFNTRFKILGIFILIAGLFDCSLLFSECQFVFWPIAAMLIYYGRNKAT